MILSTDIEFDSGCSRVTATFLDLQAESGGLEIDASLNLPSEYLPAVACPCQRGWLLGGIQRMQNHPLGALRLSLIRGHGE